MNGITAVVNTQIYGIIKKNNENSTNFGWKRISRGNNKSLNLVPHTFGKEKKINASANRKVNTYKYTRANPPRSINTTELMKQLI